MKDKKPTGYLGKAWKDMTKHELLQAFWHLWDENERNKAEVDRLFMFELGRK